MEHCFMPKPSQVCLKKVMLPAYIVVTISLVAGFRILDFSQNVRFDERPRRK